MKRSHAKRHLKTAFFWALALLWLFPLMVSLLNAFKTPTDFITSRALDLPRASGILENIKTAVNRFQLFRHFGNSFLYSVLGTALCIAVSIPAAYSVSIVRPRFSFLLFILIYLGTVFPFQLYLMPLYKIFVLTGLYDSRLGMILFYGTICTPFATFVYRSYLMSISREMIESALIDGCGMLSALPRIYLGMLKVPTAVVIVFQAMWIWNDLLFGMVLSQTPGVRPVMVSITQIAGEGGGNLPVLMSSVLLTSVPTLALFLFLRKYFIQGTSFSVK